MRIGRNTKLAYMLDIYPLDYNPVPYKRTTQRAKYSKDYKKYLDFKTLMGDKFCLQNPDAPKELYRVGKDWHARPLLKGAYFVDVIAYYKDKTHGDTDNIAKAVNDALFDDDKFVSGIYQYKYAKSGGLKVRIYEVEAGEAIDFVSSQLGRK